MAHSNSENLNARRTFLLYCGTPKSGSSWLYNYFRGHPNCEMPAGKELHVLDRIFYPEQHSKWNGFRMNLAKRKSKRLHSVKTKLEKVKLRNEISQIYIEFSMLYDLYQYPIFFNGLLSKNRNAQFTGDLTPSHCYLERKELSIIKRMLEVSGFRIKVIFAMRDPIERIYSHLRMVERNNSASYAFPKEAHKFTTASESFPEFFRQRNLERCSRYERTIRDIEAIFSPDQIKYLFFEEYFSNKYIKELCKFLELPYKKPELDTYYNRTENNLPLSEELKIEAAIFYADTYKFIAKKFYKKKIEELWPLSKSVV